MTGSLEQKKTLLEICNTVLIKHFTNFILPSRGKLEL